MPRSVGSHSAQVEAYEGCTNAHVPGPLLKPAPGRVRGKGGSIGKLAVIYVDEMCLETLHLCVAGWRRSRC